MYVAEHIRNNLLHTRISVVAKRIEGKKEKLKEGFANTALRSLILHLWPLLLPLEEKRFLPLLLPFPLESLLRLETRLQLPQW